MFKFCRGNESWDFGFGSGQSVISAAIEKLNLIFLLLGQISFKFQYSSVLGQIIRYRSVCSSLGQLENKMYNLYNFGILLTMNERLKVLLLVFLFMF